MFTMRCRHVIVVVVMFFIWNLLLMYLTLVNRSPKPVHNHVNVNDRLIHLEEEIQGQLNKNEQTLKDLWRKQQDPSQEVVIQAIPKVDKPNGTKGSDNKLNYDKVGADNVVLPVLMIACNRVDAIKRSLALVLKYRPNEKRFPIIVSQDCGHHGTAEMIRSYQNFNKDIIHIQQPDLRKLDIPWPQRNLEDYYKISRHYKWALDQVFHKFKHSAVIIVEDDLDISPDFFEYFAATFRVLKADNSLWCVSAWNDNGKKGMVKEDPELLHRTDFFPGLGWMFARTLWFELGPKWPATFWDDWMRHPDQRKDRSCIRPEISRTSTFGKKGVSKGLFFDQHLKLIQLNEKYVPFTERDLSYLIKENYDPAFQQYIYSVPEVPLNSIDTGQHKDMPEVRVTYRTGDDFKDIAKRLGIMDDIRAGVERTAYRGVVSFSHNGQRVHAAPPADWKGYDHSWAR